jgi:hypothetical protein
MKIQLPAPGANTPSSNGDFLAAEFFAKELPDARRALRRTQIWGVVLILFMGAYIGIISTILVGFFQPQAAAEVANGMLKEHFAKDGPVLLTQVEQEIPRIIQATPDLLIHEIPAFRQQMQEALAADCQTYCIGLTREFGTRMDQYIDAHQSEIHTLLENAGDRDAMRKALPDFDQYVTDTLLKNTEGQAAKEHIDAWEAALKEVDQRVDRLANAQDLSPEEIKARHALALLSAVTRQNTQLPDTNSILLHPLKVENH